MSTESRNSRAHHVAPQPNQLHVVAKNDGLIVHAYPVDGAVLLSFDLENPPDPSFAGFAIRCTPPEGKPFWLHNRLNFKQAITRDTTPEQREWTPSNEAPFQKFRWIDFSSLAGDHTYDVMAMYFPEGWSPGTALKPGASCTVTVPLGVFDAGKFRMGFTRGYLSSQAYAERFENAAIRPPKKSIDFDTAEFEEQWDWLGAHGRKLVYEFLDEAVQNENVLVDALVYDFDEPNIVAKCESLGGRLRIFMDDSRLHASETAMEPKARERLEKSAGEDNVRTGHFRRFAHCKVLIQRDAASGKALKVLTGSANFSIRGLYVQSNNILVFDDPTTADLYAQAFDQTFDDPAGFAKSTIASDWFDVQKDDVPTFSVAFSPHKDAEISLGMVAKRIKEASSSVLFAVMELGGGGDVLDQLKKLRDRDLYSYGVTQSERGVSLYKAKEQHGVLVPFAYLHDKVPQPFKEEWSGGQGQVIHHKFVVVDFNGNHPVVFTGSSNLATGGEESNGDNLLAIHEPSVAMAYAVEAIRLVDHYHFRVSMQNASHVRPLSLERQDSQRPWWTPYWDEDHVKYRERKLFVKH